MERIYGSDYTTLHLTGKALEAYNAMGDITIVEHIGKAYTIKPEFIHLWGDEANADTVIWDDELESYASEWETTESDLLDQLDNFPVYSVKGQAESSHLMTADELVNWLECGME